MPRPNGCQIILLAILFGAPVCWTRLALIAVIGLERWYRKALAARYDSERYSPTDTPSRR